MTVSDVYKQFKINHGLQQHMLRVGAVAKQIADSCDLEVDQSKLITACLLHDLGNIVKAKFTDMPELFEPEGVAYYQAIQKEVIDKYGTDDHEVTLGMLAELGVDVEVSRIMAATSMRNVVKVATAGDLSEKLMMYSDTRVGPKGILSIKDRLDELELRTVPHRYTPELFAAGRAKLFELEAELFSGCDLQPDDITDESIIGILERLPQWEIE